MYRAFSLHPFTTGTIFNFQFSILISPSTRSSTPPVHIYNTSPPSLQPGNTLLTFDIRHLETLNGIESGAQSLQPPLPGSTWLSRHLLWHKVPKIFDVNIKILFISMLELSTKIYPRNYCFLVLRRTGFNNIVPYNATRQGMPGYELPGVLRDPLMTVDLPKIFAPHILCQII